MHRISIFIDWSNKKGDPKIALIAYFSL
jgi:hypothetical protein